MPRLSKRFIEDAFERGDAATTPLGKGAALEDVMVHILGRVSGMRFQRRDVLVANGSEEIDLVFWNDRLPAGLPFMPNVVMVECKNWSASVGSSEVGFFCQKVQTRRLGIAIFVAANGITGAAAERTAANQTVDSAFMHDETKLIVLSRREIEGLASTQAFVKLLQDKLSAIIMRVPFC